MGASTCICRNWMMLLFRAAALRPFALGLCICGNFMQCTSSTLGIAFCRCGMEWDSNSIICISLNPGATVIIIIIIVMRWLRMRKSCLRNDDQLQGSRVVLVGV